MKLYYFLVAFLLGYAGGNIVNNVRLVDFAAYMIEVISTTVKEVEQKSWCTLRVPDVAVDIDEVVLGWHANGTLHYKNGFVNSIQSVDIRQDTVQSTVTLNSEQQAQALVRGTLRMHHVNIGYDVEAVLEDGTSQYTTSYSYPLINFVFTIIRVINTENTTVTVVGNVPNSSNLADFVPKDKASDVFTSLFNPTMSVDGIDAWGPEVFKPLVDDAITKINFPNICYNCPA